MRNLISSGNHPWTCDDAWRIAARRISSKYLGGIFHNAEVEGMPNEDYLNGGQVRFIKYDARLITANAETVGGPDALSSMELSIDPRPPARLKTERPRLLSELPARLSTDLFAGAALLRLPSGKMLFRAGDPMAVIARRRRTA
jgi:hypothetical protein